MEYLFYKTWKIHGKPIPLGNPKLYLNVKLFFFLELSSFYLFLTAFCPCYQGPPCMSPGSYLSCDIEIMLWDRNLIKKNNESWDPSLGPCDPKTLALLMGPDFNPSRLLPLMSRPYHLEWASKFFLFIPLPLCWALPPIPEYFCQVGQISQNV